MNSIVENRRVRPSPDDRFWVNHCADPLHVADFEPSRRPYDWFWAKSASLTLSRWQSSNKINDDVNHIHVIDFEPNHRPLQITDFDPNRYILYDNILWVKLINTAPAFGSKSYTIQARLNFLNTMLLDFTLILVTHTLVIFDRRQKINLENKHSFTAWSISMSKCCTPIFCFCSMCEGKVRESSFKHKRYHILWTPL